MRRLRRGHIILAQVPSLQKSRPTVITFKKVTRAGRNPTYKRQIKPVSDDDTTPAPPSPRPTDMLLDDDLARLYQDDPQDPGQAFNGLQGSGEALWEDDDVRLPRRATVSKASCWFSMLLNLAQDCPRSPFRVEKDLPSHVHTSLS